MRAHPRWIVLGFASLLSLAAGCGNVVGGGITTDPEPPAADDDDDGGNDDGGTTGDDPTPDDDTPGGGAPPETLGGWFSLGNIRVQGNDPPGGIGGSGSFYAQPVPLIFMEPWEALFGGYPDMELDTCGGGYGASIAISGSGQITLAAGDVSIASPSGTGSFFFLPLGGLQLYLAQAMPGVFVGGGADYTLAGTGAQVGAFSTTFPGPPDILVTEPANLTAGTGPRTIDRSQDIPLAWESEKDGLPLFVFLMQYEVQDGTPFVYLCKFEDDGEATIPASAMQYLEPTAYQIVDTMQILKYRIHTFEAPGATGPVLVNFSSGYDIDVIFE